MSLNHLIQPQTTPLDVEVENIQLSTINGAPYTPGGGATVSTITPFSPVWSFFNVGPAGAPVLLSSLPCIGTIVDNVVTISGRCVIQVQVGTNSEFQIQTTLPAALVSTLITTGGVSLSGGDSTADFTVCGDGVVQTNTLSIEVRNTLGTLYDGQKTIQVSWTGQYALN